MNIVPPPLAEPGFHFCLLLLLNDCLVADYIHCHFALDEELHRLLLVAYSYINTLTFSDCIHLQDAYPACVLLVRASKILSESSPRHAVTGRTASRASVPHAFV